MRDLSEIAAAAPDHSGLSPQAPATIRDAVRSIERALDLAGVEESIVDARLLAAHALGASPTWIFSHEPDAFPAARWAALRELVGRRRAREPLQHLLGVQEFWSMRLAVSPAVLIPRPETEHLVEAALEALRGLPSPRIADIGTGSGALALALAREVPAARVVAVDISEDALDVARGNARALGLDDRVEFRHGHLAQPLVVPAEKPFDAIVANLPYVTSAEWEELEPEVRDHEPRLALVGGEDGLDLVRELIADAPRALAPGGFLGLELGWKQAGAVRDLLAAADWSDVATRQDLAGIERVVSGRAPKERDNP